MGWRELSEDAQHFAFWLSLVGAVLTAIAAGLYWNWWSYAWDVPPPIRALVVLAAVVLSFVLWYFVVVIGHHYLGWPRTHPFSGAKHAEAEGSWPSLAELEREAVKTLLPATPGEGVWKHQATYPAHLELFQRNVAGRLRLEGLAEPDVRTFEGLSISLGGDLVEAGRRLIRQASTSNQKHAATQNATKGEPLLKPAGSLPAGEVSWDRERVKVEIPEPRGCASLAQRGKLACWAEGLGRWDEWAVHNLWANHPKNQQELKLWRQSFHQWSQDVKRWMETAGCEYLDVKEFFVLGSVPAQEYHSDVTLNQELSMLDLHRQRLKQLIERFRTALPPIHPSLDFRPMGSVIGDAFEKVNSALYEAQTGTDGAHLIGSPSEQEHWLKRQQFILETVKRIMREAAEHERSGDMSLDTGDGGFARVRLNEFLCAALRAGLYDTVLGVQRDLIRKGTPASQAREARAKSLEDLADRLTTESLDPEFYPPQSFADILKPR